MGFHVGRFLPDSCFLGGSVTNGILGFSNFWSGRDARVTG